MTKGGNTLSEIRVTKDGPYLVAGELPLAKATIGANATASRSAGNGASLSRQGQRGALPLRP